MPSIEVINKTRGSQSTVLARPCVTFWSRFRGLMLRPAIAPNEGLLFDEGRDLRLNASIHMFFMRFPIAVIWINSDLRVVDTCQAFPWRPYYAPSRPARYILETHIDRIADFHINDLVELRHIA